MRKSCRLLVIFVLWLGVTVQPSWSADFSAGVHYFELIEPQPVQTGKQIEVLELFWYGCPHCYTLEPVVDEWLKTKPTKAELVRLPAVLRDSWAFHARLYFAFEALDVLDKVHTEFFDEIHKRRNRINSLEALTPFLAAHGIPKDDFMDAYESFAVDSKLRHALLMSNRYEATGVPTMIVDGKYRATASSAGGHEQLMELVNFLVAKAAKERE
jgi:thiol:disulfide interchange protein DsbA